MRLLAFFDSITPNLGYIVPSETSCNTRGTAYADVSGWVNSLPSHFVVKDDLPTSGYNLSNYMRSLGFLIGNTPRNGLMPIASMQTFVSEPVELEKDFEYTSTVKPESSYRAFKARQESGEIVINPLTKVMVRISDAPIFQNLSHIPGLATVPWGQLTPGMPDGRCVNVYRNPAGFPSGRYWLAYGLQSTRYATADYRLYTATGYKSIFRQAGKPYIDALLIEIAGMDPPGNIVNEALDEVYSGTYDILTELGEAPDTIRYIYDTLRRIILVFLKIKSREAIARKQFKGKELIDEIASLWMQFRYAVSPLAYSVADVLELQNKTNAYITARKRVDMPFRHEAFGYVYEGTVEHRVFAKARIDANALTAHLGLNPVKTLWELTPLSFVVDWVLPIGSMLGALLPPSNEVQTVISHSRRIRSMDVTYGETRLSCTADIYINTPISTRPNLAVPDVNLNWKRSLDALALAWGMFLKQHWKS